MAYFSNQGEKIFSGAAGLGHYGPLRSFRDGSLGAMATMIDGSERCRARPELPECQKKLWSANVRYEETEPEYIIVPPPRAHRLPLKFATKSVYSKYSKLIPAWGYGPVRGTMMAFKDGVLGSYGPLQSFHDGSLGGGLEAFHDGSLGAENPTDIGEYYTASATGEYFTGTAGCGSCGGLGAAEATLNLSDPATLKEVKSLVAYSPLMVANAGLPETQADIENPKWTAYTTQLVDQLLMLNAMQLSAQWDATPEASRPKAADGSQLTKDQYLASVSDALNAAFPSPERYPTYDGVMLLRSMLATAPISVPNVDNYIKAGGGPVSPPNQVTQANMMGIGIGVAVVALLGALFFSGKKK